jgi:hypothetical protein
MGWRGHLGCMGEIRNMHRILVGDLKVDCLVVLDVDGRLMLKWVLEKQDVNCF